MKLRADVKLKELDAVSLASMLIRYSDENLPAAPAQQLRNAIQLGAFLHRNDYRRGARGGSQNPPYFEHPLRVATRLMRGLATSVTADMLIAAVLHDTVEDHAEDFSLLGGTEYLDFSTPESARNSAFLYLSNHYPPNSVELIRLLSNPLDDTKTYHQHIMEVIEGNSPVRQEALAIKMSDYFDNAGSLHHHYPTTGNAPKLVTKYKPLVRLFRNVLVEQGSIINGQEANRRLNEIEDYFNNWS